MGRVQTAAKNNATTFAAMGAAATTLAGFLCDAARAAAEEEAIFAQLEAAVDATGESFDEYAGQIDQAIAKAEDLSFADDAAATGLTKLTTITQDAGEAIDLMGLTMDVARGRGIALSEAATLVGRAAEGQTTALTRYGDRAPGGGDGTRSPRRRSRNATLGRPRRTPTPPRALTIASRTPSTTSWSPSARAPATCNCS